MRPPSVNFQTLRAMTERGYPEDSEVGAPRVVHNHYSQSKNGNGSDTGRLNTILLAALIAIIGFVGVNVWNMNDRLARVETNVSTLLTRP